MRALIEAITEWIQADTVLKLIDADSRAHNDYGRGYQDGLTDANNFYIDAETWDDE